MYSVHILGLFPKESEQFFLKGIFKRAQDAKRVKVTFIDIREFGKGIHRKVDDYPFGDKTGMLLRADVIYQAVTSVPDYQAYDIIYTCPKGPVLNQVVAEQLSQKKGLIIILGYYKGVDERIFKLLSIRRISLGDFVLSSGEVPAFAIIEAVIRLLPGVIGNPASMKDDSLLQGCLSPPQYTQPKDCDGHVVPDVVVSGDHPKRIFWERKQSLSQTLFTKPTLLLDTELTNQDQQLLQEIIQSSD